MCCQRVEDNAFHPAKTAGVHRIVYKNYHRALAARFPFALYYSVSEQTASIRAIVDCRREPVDQRTSAMSSFRLYAEPTGWQLASAYLHIGAPIHGIGGSSARRRRVGGWRT
jgi:hypothetical protein